MRDRPLFRIPRLLLVVCATLTTFGIERTSRADDTASVDERTMAEARRYFQAGVNLLDDPDGARYEDAYNAFHRAYELSKSPKVLGNIGFCALKLERDGEAIEAYSTYLRESRDVDPRERSQIERDLSTLSSSVASFKAVAPKGVESFTVVDTRLQTRGAPVVNSYALTGNETTIRVRPGRHSLKIKANDLESRPYEISIEAGSQNVHEFSFAPPAAAPVVREAPPPAPSYAGPILLGLVGLAAIGTGTATGLMARGTTDDIRARCPNDVCPANYDLKGPRTEAKTLGTVADISFASGGLALGGALLWAILIPSHKSSKPARVGSIDWRPSAACSGRGCDVVLGGAF